MFLKSMELSGFKSFADKTVLRFDEGITGIVGPNGCGKSNVNDAIRWVLGEQSTKSLRSGTSMADIIFSGSESRKPVHLARVTLCFDNTSRIFASPFDEIEITREIRRNGDTACFINQTPCRLKDITDLVMDTGLGRDSLSIISQGNISAFAEARPEERRLLFEEAAGVAKYKKRKKVTLGRLEGMQENLSRVQDLLDELEKQVSALQEQAIKAREYQSQAQELADMEISVLAIQIGEYKEKLDELTGHLKELQGLQALESRRLDAREGQLEDLQKELFVLDQEIAGLQEQYGAVLEESYGLQRRKDQLDEKRKYALEAADASQKVESLQVLVQEARYEWEDRAGRLEALEQQADHQNRQVAQSRQKRESLAQQQSRQEEKIQQLTRQKMTLENKLAAPASYAPGISAILQARLPQIEGLVGSLLECEPEYEAALQSALGSAAQQIVTPDEAAARQAIAWLKKNRAGRATFLPLSVCRPKTLQSWQQPALKQPGIVGCMADLTRCDRRYEALKGRLLGNILLARTLEQANETAACYKHSLKIVTLEGDVVHAGGAMSGGSWKSSSLGTLRRELEVCESQLQEALQEKDTLEQSRQKLESQLSRQLEEQMQSRIDVEKLSSLCQVKKEKYQALQEEYRQVCELAGTGMDNSSEMQSDSLVAQLSRIHEKLDTLSSQLKTRRALRLQQGEEARQYEEEIRDLRRRQSEEQSSIHQQELEKTRLETRLEEALMRLNSTYSLTYEAACAQKKDVDVKSSLARIKALRLSLQKLGDVNLQAPAMLEETEQKASYLRQQKEELESAAAKLLEAIDEMDQTMTEQFSTMFHAINEQLDGVFKAMFGGGHAQLSMTDPEDILHTGIDIDVQPPGKMVKNIQTFSGGEKALIAISVLFAILKARTMPLCIFDEVEAALDQANVERFARYLQHFKDQSQFIVVTHRPGTMEECDTLYGITMQKDGVSQVLKVLLKDAAQYAKE